MDIEIIRRYLEVVGRRDLQAKDISFMLGFFYRILLHFFPRLERPGHGEVIYLRKRMNEFRENLGYKTYCVLKDGTYEELSIAVNEYLMALATRVGNNYKNGGSDDEHKELMKRFRKAWAIANMFVECPSYLAIRDMAFEGNEWKPPDRFFV